MYMYIVCMCNNYVFNFGVALIRKRTITYFLSMQVFIAFLKPVENLFEKSRGAKMHMGKMRACYSWQYNTFSYKGYFNLIVMDKYLVIPMAMKEGRLSLQLSRPGA